MTDVLEQLRDLNPVEPSSLQISSELRARALAAGSPPLAQRRRSLTLGVSAVAAAVLVVLLIASTQSGAPELAARAYAATTGSGVIHWRTDLVSSVNGKVGSRQRVEGWTRDGVTHELRYDVVHGKPILQSDSRFAQARATIWIRAENAYLRVRASRSTRSNPLGSGDPFEIFRHAYRTGRLKKIGASRFHADLPGRSNDDDDPALVYYDIDPRSALPVRLVLTTPSRAGAVGASTIAQNVSRTVMTFAVYEELPFNAATRTKLRLLPHPGAGQSSRTNAASSRPQIGASPRCPSRRVCGDDPSR